MQNGYYSPKRVIFTENLQGFCLSYFDIVIIEHENDLVNNIILGAPWNYFGTIINGTGRFVSEDIDITVRDGETVFIPKGCVYRSEWHGTPSARFYSLPFTFAEPHNNIRFSLQKVGDTGVFEDVEKIYKARKALCLDAFSHFYNLFERVSKRLSVQTHSSNLRSIRPALNYIEKNCAADFDVPYLSSLCGMGQSNFYALFKKLTGYTPIEYKNRRRCMRAAELLVSTDYTVEYISEKLNFSSPMYMRRVLHKFTGKTPGALRRERNLLI